MGEKNDKGDVGYGRPPQHSRFKPGESGNRRGRPKGVISLKAELVRELSDTIEGSGEGPVTKGRAMVKKLVESSLNGDPKIAIALIGLYAKLFGNEEPDPRSDDDDAFVDKLAERERQSDGKISVDPPPNATDPRK